MSSLFVTSEVVRQLADKHQTDILDSDFIRAVYSKEIARFDRGIYGELKEIDEEAYRRERVRHIGSLTEDMSKHLARSLHHISASGRRQVVVFLDKIDQRSADLQERAFVMSEALANRWPATVFISLRSETFHASRRNGVLSVFQPRVFTISPPRVDIVLKKRIEFARRHLADSSSLRSLPAGTTVRSPSLEAFLAVLAENFESNDRLIRLVDNLSGGNIRLALTFLGSFIGSGHTSSLKLVAAYERDGSYWIPVHEFLRALMFGEREYFDPDQSPISNIFGISRPDGREHFLAAILIAFAHASGEASGGNALISVDDLYAHAQAIGFDEEQIANAISRAVAGRLLEASQSGVAATKSQYFRVTTAGI